MALHSAVVLLWRRSLAGSISTSTSAVGDAHRSLLHESEYGAITFEGGISGRRRRVLCSGGEQHYSVSQSHAELIVCTTGWLAGGVIGRGPPVGCLGDDS